jgi:AAA+ ATPase superfamily predicted ATPase
VQELIDRVDERDRLAEAAARAPQLVIMRGRRRVGKSFLLEQTFAEHRHVSYQADEQPERGQLESLAKEAAELLPGSPPLVFADWNAALTFFGNQAKTAPLVLVLDEFQWMARSQPALPSILQRHWDQWQRAGTPLTVVLSGSALTLMEELLDSSSPLFGRADYRPLIQPLDYRSAAAFARSGQSADALLERYAVLGGTPQYQVWAGKGALSTVIRSRILAKGESLYEEPLHLLREEQQIRDTGTYFAVLAAIAGGANKFNEIVQRAQVNKNLELVLTRLAALGYIEKRTPVESNPASGRSLYRMADPFFRFWFRYVFPNRSRLEQGRVDQVLDEIERDAGKFMGLAFEDRCREWIGRHAQRADLPTSATLGSWWSRDGQIEIDIVGLTADRYDLLGSCQWSKWVKPKALQDLLEARDHLGGKAARATLVLLARGFSPQAVAFAEQEDVLLVSASELLE